jgi:hypothetical protein
MAVQLQRLEARRVGASLLLCSCLCLSAFLWNIGNETISGDVTVQVNLNSNQWLQYLDLKGCEKLSPSLLAQFFAPAQQKYPHLTYLNLAGCHLLHNVRNLVGHLIARCPALRSLDISIARYGKCMPVFPLFPLRGRTAWGSARQNSAASLGQLPSPTWESTDNSLPARPIPLTRLIVRYNPKYNAISSRNVTSSLPDISLASWTGKCILKRRAINHFHLT